jgi:hypothetical protein
LREEHRPRVFESSETKRIFQHKRQELSVDCRLLTNEELRDLYFLPITWAGHVARTMEKRITNRVLADITGIDYLEYLNKEEKNFKMDLTEIRWEEVSSITLSRGRISGGYWNRGTEHSDFVKCGEFF